MKAWWRHRASRARGKRTGWTARILWRYALVQVPAAVVLILVLILVQRWVAIPRWVVWGLVALWLAKDAVLFPLVWRAYDWERRGETHPMLWAHGVAKERLEPGGYVRVGHELWKAEIVPGGLPIAEGEAVRVRAVRGLTLIVEPFGGGQETGDDLPNPSGAGKRSGTPV